jgi:hypothetical protein
MRKPAYERCEAGETRRQLLTVSQNVQRGSQVTTIGLGAMEVGHDDDNPSIGNGGWGNSGGRVFAQGMLAQSPLASCLLVSAWHHQAQRLNPPRHGSAAAID